MSGKKSQKSVFRRLSGEETARVFQELSRVIEPHCELRHETALDLLVAVVLSAQATDESVNKVTPDLWRTCRVAEDYLVLGEDGIAEKIRSIGLYRNKAKSIVGACRRLLEAYGGVVPDTREELMTLPGVGRKTANVILNVWFKQPTLAVDTHVQRVANRLGLTQTATPEATEQALLAVVPAAYLLNAHHYLLLHGRYTCTARAPHCDGCPLGGLCPRNGVNEQKKVSANKQDKQKGTKS